MGRQKGIVHLSGQYGDTQLAIDGKKGISKFHTPVGKDKILTEDAYDLMRRNMAEFTGASRATDSFLGSLGQDALSFGDRYLRSRIVARMRKIVKDGPGIHGERSFEASNFLNQFKHLELSKKDSFKNRFHPPYVVTVNTDRNTATLQVPTFRSRGYVKPPKGANLFEVTLTVGVLSDFFFTGDKDVYTPVNPDLNEKHAAHSSGILPCDNVTVVGGFQLVASIPTLPVLPADAILVVSLSIEFFMDVNGHKMLFAQGNAKRVHEAY